MKKTIASVLLFLHRVVFMAEGEIVEDAPPDSFFTQPRSDRAKDFLGKILSH